MNDSIVEAKQQVQLALRTGAGHERTAKAAEEQGLKTFEMKMKSAGASVYEAFVVAVKKLAPEYQGRKIDDKAIQRIYQSTRARPWWDKELATVKVEGKPATREWAWRTIQWHIDPEGAKARRTRRIADDTARRNKLSAKQNRTSHGPRGPQAEPTTVEMREIHHAAQGTALASRELPRLEHADVHATREDCYGEINRIKVALGKMKEGAQYDAAVELLKAAAREIERIV